MKNTNNNIEITVSKNKKGETIIDIKTKGVSKMELLSIFELLKLNTFDRLNGNVLDPIDKDGRMSSIIMIN